MPVQGGARYGADIKYQIGISSVNRSGRARWLGRSWGVVEVGERFTGVGRM